MKISFVILSFYYSVEELNLLHSIILKNKGVELENYETRENFCRIEISFVNPIKLLEVGYEWGFEIERDHEKNKYFLKKKIFQKNKLDRMTINYLPKISFELSSDEFEQNDSLGKLELLRKIIYTINEPSKDRDQTVKEEYYFYRNDIYYLCISFTNPIMLIQVARMWGQSFYRNLPD